MVHMQEKQTDKTIIDATRSGQDDWQQEDDWVSLIYPRITVDNVLFSSCPHFSKLRQDEECLWMRLCE